MENIPGQMRLRKQSNTEKIFIPSNQVFVPLVANRHKSDCTQQGSVCNYNTNLLMTKVGIVNYIDIKGCSVTVPIYPDMKTFGFVRQTEKKIPKDCKGIAFVIHALMHGHYSENIGIPTFI
jgi:Pyruvate/2-oxoacid:ferredoxin oxidoreductase delta subunit